MAYVIQTYLKPKDRQINNEYFKRQFNCHISEHIKFHDYTQCNVSIFPPNRYSADVAK